MDRLLWQFERQRIYSVRSGYRLAFEQNFEVEFDDENAKWTEVWRLNIPPKVRNFIWRTCNDLLPLRANLFSRGMSIEDKCILCDFVGEHSLHLFVDCPCAVDCFSRINIDVVNLAADSFSGWLASMFSATTEVKDRELLCMVLWQIWVQRNNKCWNTQVIPPEQSVRTCKILLEDYQRENACRGISNAMNNQDVLDRWQRPPIGTVKVNFDIATNGTRKLLGFAAVCRDNEGRVLSCWSRTMAGKWHVLVAEAMCLRFVLQWVLVEGLSDVIIETDAKGVVDRMRSFDVDLSDVGGVIETCRGLIRHCNLVRIQHVKRSANSLADRLARASFNWSQPMFWLSVPQFVREIADTDIINSV
ncbi:hypothetical protein M5689_006303 [Euphorbia peplus]|nr:hypothetical protein M5689_006303 [Euphorbia peplus]